jgi:hypothetical protein
MTADGYLPSAVLDNDPASIWAAQPVAEPFTPQWIGIDMGVPVTMQGLVVTPVHGLAGWPASFQIETSPDLVNWSVVPGTAYDLEKNPYKPSEGPQNFVFDPPVTARYVRFLATRLRGAGTAIVTNEQDYRLAIADMQVIAG